MTFTTPLTLSGPFRSPRQMLAEQEYGGHASLHDDETAARLGFRAGPIEGPTHFSLFDPLLYQIWGKEWFESGCMSCHFLTMAIEGEETRAFVEIPERGARVTRAWAEKRDGARILEASVSVGPQPEPTLLERRLQKTGDPERLVILRDLSPGMQGAEDEIVRMDADSHMGALYPFSLRQKLALITEPSPWYADDSASPWGRAIIPREMISVLSEYSSSRARFPVRGPAVGLFADLEIRLLRGPLFVGENYLIRREIVALGETRRTESYWVRSQIYDQQGSQLLGQVLLNHAVLKASFADYETEKLDQS